MSYFSLALESILDRRGITQAELAGWAGIQPSRMSTYIHATGRPTYDVLTKLCASAGEDAVPLLVGYLKDEIPVPMRDRVDIVAVENTLRDGDVMAWADWQRLVEKLGEAERKILFELGRAMLLQSKVVPALQSFLDLIKPQE